LLKSEKKTINGHVYEVTQLPYSPGHKLLLLLGRKLGPALATAFAGIPNKKNVDLGDREIATLAPAFSEALSKLLQDLDEASFDFMVETLAHYSKIEIKEGVMAPLKGEMEMHFASNYGELFQWLLFALRINYVGFSGEQNVVSALLEKIKVLGEAYRSRSTSTGTSTKSRARGGTKAP